MKTKTAALFAALGMAVAPIALAPVPRRNLWWRRRLATSKWAVHDVVGDVAEGVALANDDDWARYRKPQAEPPCYTLPACPITRRAMSLPALTQCAASLAERQHVHDATTLGADDQAIMLRQRCSQPRQTAADGGKRLCCGRSPLLGVVDRPYGHATRGVGPTTNVAADQHRDGTDGR